MALLRGFGRGLPRLRRGVLLLALSLAVACGSDAADDAIVSPPASSPTPEPVETLTLEPAFGGRPFVAPNEVGSYPGGRMFVAEQHGLVTVLSPDGSEALQLLGIQDRVDLEKGEGLLSFALDPDFEDNGHVWAYYFRAGVSETRLSRFTVAADVAAPESELRVLDLEQPGYNQNGGAVRFGPDGMLYLSLGDGSAAIDPFDNGQDLSTLLAAVIRLDVSNASEAEPYAVPSDNPFVGTAGARSEIWAYGLRNPWRMAFDPLTGTLWGGDVGISDAEEVNVFEAGGNYGWSLREGFECLAGRDNCLESSIDPVAVYAHDDGRCAVTGGLVYRGEALPRLTGRYLFGDFCTGEVFAMDAVNPGAFEVVAQAPPQLVSFGVDAAGEVYLAVLDGTIWRLIAR